MTPMKAFLLVVAAVHGFFMVFELFPWSFPVLLKIVSKKLPDLPRQPNGPHEPNGRKWSKQQQPLVATIVQNAGIYNGILAGGLLWAALALDPALAVDPARDMARVLLAGAAVAGIFGTATLKSPVTAAQALFGIIGLVWLNR
jgi:putative membrane protein